MNTKTNTHAKRGFTLVEVLVSTGIFTLAVSLGVLSVVTMNSAAKRIQVKDQAVQSAYFLMDTMSRSIRTGDTYRCTDSSGNEGAVTSCATTSAAGVSYVDQEGRQVKLRFRSIPNTNYGVIERKLPTDADYVKLHDEYALKIKNALFFVNGETPGDTSQPYISIRLIVVYSYKEQEYTIPIQTMLAQRKLDI